MQTATLLERSFTKISFWNMYQKKAVLKRVFWETRLWWTGLLIKFWTCGTHPAVLLKKGAHVRSFCRSTQNFNVFTGKPPWWTLLAGKVAGLEFISASQLTMTPPRGFCKIALFKVFCETSLSNIFLTKLQASNLQVATLLKIMCLTKKYRDRI